MTHYFCYQCERAVPIEAGANLQCPQCAGDFLEELAPNDPRMPSPHPFGIGLRNPGTTHSPARSPGSQPAQSISQNAIRVSFLDLLLMARGGVGPLAGIQGPPPVQPRAASRQNPQRQQTASSPYVGFRLQAEEAEEVNEEVDLGEDEPAGLSIVAPVDTEPGEGDAENPDEEQREHVEDVNEDDEEEDEEDGGPLAALHRLRTLLLAQQGNGNRAISLQNFLEAMGPLLGYHGNPGDYVTQEQYDALISRMMDEKKPDFKPASEEFIDKLEKRTYTSTDGQLDCSVCRDDFKEGEVYNVLPCTHLFHKDCITSWLKENNNCPLCRQKFDAKAD